MSKLDTRMNGFDIVSAITQRAINRQFVNLKKLGVIPDTANIELGMGLGELVAKLEAPTVILGDRENRRRVVCLFHFASGTFTWREMSKGDDEEIKVHTVPFGRMQIGLKVDMNLAAIDVSQTPEAVRAAVKNLGEGMFSMRQLLLDFQSAALASYDKAHTSLPAELADNEAFATAFVLFTRKLEREGGNVLGYVVDVTDPERVAPKSPTLVPTDLDFATHVFTPGEGNVSSPDLDTLSYLLMTEKRALPKDALPEGNFVDAAKEGERAVDGTMAISHASFVEGFLLPRLAAVVNRRAILGTVTWGDAVKAADGFDPFIHFDKRMPFAEASMGKAAKRELLKKRDNSGPSQGVGVALPAPVDIENRCWRHGSWDYAEKRESTGWMREIVVCSLLSHETEVRIDAGTSAIALRGMSVLTSSRDEIRNDMVGPVAHGGESNTLLVHTAAIDWEATITFLTVQRTGELDVEVTFSSAVTTSSEGNWLGERVKELDAERDKRQVEDIGKNLSELINAKELVHDLEAALASANTFIFPGGEQYFFKDLTFNRELDLLATLTLKAD